MMSKKFYQSVKKTIKMACVYFICLMMMAFYTDFEIITKVQAGERQAGEHFEEMKDQIAIVLKAWIALKNQEYKEGIPSLDKEGNCIRNQGTLECDTAKRLEAMKAAVKNFGDDVKPEMKKKMISSIDNSAFVVYALAKMEKMTAVWDKQREALDLLLAGTVMNALHCKDIEIPSKEDRKNNKLTPEQEWCYDNEKNQYALNVIKVGRIAHALKCVEEQNPLRRSCQCVREPYIKNCQKDSTDLVDNLKLCYEEGLKEKSLQLQEDLQLRQRLQQQQRQQRQQRPDLISPQLQQQQKPDSISTELEQVKQRIFQAQQWISKAHQFQISLDKSKCQEIHAEEIIRNFRTTFLLWDATRGLHLAVSGLDQLDDIKDAIGEMPLEMETQMKLMSYYMYWMNQRMINMDIDMDHMNRSMGGMDRSMDSTMGRMRRGPFGALPW